MKKLISLLWNLFCTGLMIFFLPSALSAYIPPSVFPYISFFALLFPYAVLLMLLAVTVNLFVRKKLALLMFCVLLLGYRNLVNCMAFHSYHWKSAQEPHSLRIMTWNVEGFLSLLPQRNPMAAGRVHMLNVIRSLSPDVLCLQEYNNVEREYPLVSIRHELDSLGYHYHFFSNDRVMGTPGGWYQVQGVAIYSKLPFTDSSRTPLNSNYQHNENLASATLLFDQKPVCLFTGHLLSFSLFPDTSKSVDERDNIYQQAYDRKRPIAYKLREIEEIHEKEVKIIRSAMEKSPYPVIYCGDMNTTPASYSFRYLKDDLQDAFLVSGSGIGNTFYKIAPTLRIDVCFADKKFRVVQCKVEPIKLSDHYPLVTDLQWK